MSTDLTGSIKLTVDAFEPAIRSEIPPSMWEAALPIGRFRELLIGTVAERTFSLVARCEVHGSEGMRAVYIKIARPAANKSAEENIAAIQQNYEVLKHWHDLFSPSGNYHVVRPVLAIPEKMIEVSEEAAGESLYDLVHAGAPWFPSAAQLEKLELALYHVGGWLRYKQGVAAHPNEFYSIDDLLAYIDLRLQLLSDDPRRRFPDHYRDRILRFIDENRLYIRPEEQLVADSHSDFNPGNVLVDGDRVTVLDFGRYVKDSYIVDVSKLYHQLSLWSFKPQYRTAIIKTLQAALLRGFGDEHIESTLMFRFFYLRHTVTHLMTVTRFWEGNQAVQLFNRWVMSRELRVLDSIIDWGRK